MGRRQKKSSSIFSMFSACCGGGGSGGDERWVEEPPAATAGYVRRVYTSDEDRGYWVAEPGIDGRASAFIAKFYESRITDPEAVLV